MISVASEDSLHSEMGEEGRTFRDHYLPLQITNPSCIVLTAVRSTLDLRAAINNLSHFRGLESEDPYLHVREFLDYCATVKYRGVSEEQIYLRLFPFSLKDKAKTWLYSLTPNSIATWTVLCSKFLAKFFPMQKTTNLRRLIMQFTQNDGEEFFTCWERFNDLLSKCPHHGFDKWQLVQFFCEGLSAHSRQLLESRSGVEFMSMAEEDLWNFLESLSESSQQWAFASRGEKGTSHVSSQPKKGGIYEVSGETNVNAKIASLTREVEALKMGKGGSSSVRPISEVCQLCETPDHTAKTCLSMEAFNECIAEQANSLNSYKKPYGSPFSDTYNPNWRNHPRFSWSQGQTQNNQGMQPMQAPMQSQTTFPPMSQQAPQYVPPHLRKPSLEETLQQFMQNTSQELSVLKTQMSQLATVVGEREKGTFPSQPVPNPKGQLETRGTSTSGPREHIQAITTLRSGRQIGTTGQTPSEDEESDRSQPMIAGEPNRTTSVVEPESHSTSDVPGQTVVPPVRNFIPAAPFPQRLQKPKKGNHFNEIMDVFKQVKINIPFLDAIQQIPSYAKFLKDLCTVKRGLNVHKKAFLCEQVSSILQHRTPPKYKDPGCPTISCVIGEHKIERALLDLGASVNLLPYSVYEQLGLGELKPTGVTLQLADRSIKIPRGIVEDVLIQVDKFFFPVDFIVLDTQPVINPDNHIPVILGRPFLATSNALINCRNGVMKLSFGNMSVELNVFDISSKHSDSDECYEVNLIESLVHDRFFQSSYEDPLEECLAHFGCDFDMDCVSEEVNALLDSTPLMDTDEWKAKVLPLYSMESPHTPAVPSVESPPKLDLKPLPAELKYAFLGPEESLPVIIAAELTVEQEAKLIDVLREHKSAIGWTIADIKGISPSVCMHRIHLEENAKASREM